MSAGVLLENIGYCIVKRLKMAMFRMRGKNVVWEVTGKPVGRLMGSKESRFMVTKRSYRSTFRLWDSFGVSCNLLDLLIRRKVWWIRFDYAESGKGVKKLFVKTLDFIWNGMDYKYRNAADMQKHLKLSKIRRLNNKYRRGKEIPTGGDKE